MKKTVVLCNILIVLFILTGCPHSNNPAGGNMKDNEQALLEKEKKTRIEGKKHNADYWTVELTSKLEDTRTIEEILNNVPRKEDIVNTVVFETFNPANFNSKDNPFSSSVEVRKKIKYNSHTIAFNLKISINTKPNVKVSSTVPLQIKLSEDSSLNIDTPEIIYKRNEDVFKETGIETQDIIATSELSIKEINLLRSQQAGFTIFLNTAEGVFKLKCPQIFIECLKEF